MAQDVSYKDITRKIEYVFLERFPSDDAYYIDLEFQISMLQH
jgi:hypothetical protein